MDGEFNGVEYSVAVNETDAGWTWICVVSGLLKSKSLLACESAQLARDAAQTEARALIAEFLSSP